MGIEAWIVLLTAVNVGVLFFVSQQAPWSVVIAILTVVDILYTLASFQIFSKAPRSVARSLFLLLLRYFQIVTAFACMQLYVQHLTECKLFVRQGAPARLSPEEALYFSVVTASTVGFGDIAPNLEAGLTLGMFARPATLVVFEVFSILVIVLMEFPRLLSRAGRP